MHSRDLVGTLGSRKLKVYHCIVKKLFALAECYRSVRYAMQDRNRYMSFVQFLLDDGRDSKMGQS